MHHYLRIVYNDALTYDPATKKGGLRANFQHSRVARAPQNRDYQLLMHELAYLKEDQVDITLDKVSVSDYIAFASMLVIKEAEGPDMTLDWKYGRKDVKNASQAGDVNQIPTGSNFKENLRGKGFENEEIVALASIQTFGLIQDPKKSDISKFPKLDNFVFKHALTKGTNSQEMDAVARDNELNEIVKKFAEDNKAYHQSFKAAFVKMINLGHDEADLNEIESLMDNWPYNKFLDIYY